MKTVDKKIIELVETLYMAIDIRKTAEAQEKELKDKLKDIMGKQVILEAGLYTAMKRPCIRNGIDTAKLKRDFSAEVLLNYATLTRYDVLEIVPNDKTNTLL